MIFGGSGDGRETFRANKDVDGARQGEGRRRARRELQPRYSRNSKNVAGCDPPMHTGGKLRNMLGNVASLRENARRGREGEDSPCRLTRAEPNRSGSLEAKEKKAAE